MAMTTCPILKAERGLSTVAFTQGAHCGLDWDLHPESKLVCAEIIEGVRKTSSHPFRDTVPPFTPLTLAFCLRDPCMHRQRFLLPCCAPNARVACLLMSAIITTQSLQKCTHHQHRKQIPWALTSYSTKGDIWGKYMYYVLVRPENDASLRWVQ